MKRLTKVRVLLAVLLLIGVAASLAYFWTHDPRQLLAQNQGLQHRLDDLGIWAMVLLAAAYVVACVLLIPGSLLTLAAGVLFGVVRGTIVVSIGSTLGAVAAFLVGRYLARDWIAKKVAANAKFQAVDRAVGQQGWKIVLLARLSPVFPFNLLNYAFGLTKVSLRDYFLASWIGMLPGTLMYVYFGSAFKNLAELATGKVQGGVLGQVFFGVGLLATIAVTVYVTRVAKRTLDQSALAGVSLPTPDTGEAHA